MSEKRIRLTTAEIDIIIGSLTHMRKQHKEDLTSRSNLLAWNLIDRLKTGTRGRDRSTNYRMIVEYGQDME